MKRLFDLMRMTCEVFSGRGPRPRRRVPRVESLDGRTLLSVTMFPYPLPSMSLSITVGSDHALWFTEESGRRVDRLDPSTGAVTELRRPALELRERRRRHSSRPRIPSSSRP